jgi:hypothetical protein
MNGEQIYMKTANLIALAMAGSWLLADTALANFTNMRTIQEMCGPTQGHREWVDQTECVLRVLPLSDNPDLIPSNPYIGWYTAMALKMIDDVKNNRTSEAEARANVQQAYHEVMVRQAQAAESDLEQESIERQRVAAVKAEIQATKNERQAVYDDRAAAIAQARADRFCANAARSVEDTCSISTRNPKVGIGLCVAARILYAQQGCR